MNVILIGYRCTGKTSTGRCLARQLGWPFRDTDDLVRARTGKTVAELVAEGGWEAFRAAERGAVEAVARADRHVIALGGGAVCDPRNVAELKKNGFFVWLHAAPEAIEARLGKDMKSGDNRPSLTGAPIGDEVRTVLAEREPLYRRCADLAIDTTRLGPEETAAAIGRCLAGVASPSEPPGEQKEET